jgi:hypothetical protein
MAVEANDAHAAAPSTAVDTPINGFNFTKEADSFLLTYCCQEETTAGWMWL